MFQWPDKVETDNLVIVPIARDHMVSIHKGERPILYGFTSHAQWPLPILLEAFPVMANDLMDDPDSLGWYAWALAHKENGCIIGDVGFKGRPDENGTVKVGYSVIPAYRNRGYAREALKAMTDIARSSGIVKSIRADVLALNIPSIKVLSFLGWSPVSRNDEFEVWEYHPEDG